MAGSKRKTPGRDDSAYGGQRPDRAGVGSARSLGRAGERALQQWSDARGAPNHRQAVPNALRRPAPSGKKK